MDALRDLFNRSIGRKSNKVTGIRFSKQDRMLEAKVVFVGDYGVGKTNLIWTSERKVPWMGAGSPEPRYDYTYAEVDTAYGKTALSLWDTAGQEDYDRLRPLSYPDTAMIVFVFAIDSPVTLDNINQKWKVEVDRYCPGVPKIIVGCKNDVRPQDHTGSLIDTQTGIDLARRLGAKHYVECSAQKYVGVEKLVECIANTAWELYNHSKSDSRSEPLKYELSVALPDKDSAHAAETAKDVS